MCEALVVFTPLERLSERAEEFSLILQQRENISEDRFRNEVKRYIADVQMYGGGGAFSNAEEFLYNLLN
ncbi:hypothetical protein HOD38_00930 [archaeon]|jgi:hypothetical protein|nr:hypothetical protein [archaeon]MBT4396809.1 hypothetical protein [archaeon]MBT4441513.1 hypothetical protein [archaeon]